MNHDRGGNGDLDGHSLYPSYHYLSKHCPEPWLKPYYLPYTFVNVSDPAYWTDLTLTFNHHGALVMEHGKVKGIMVTSAPPDWLQKESQRVTSDEHDRRAGGSGGKEWQTIKLLLLLYWIILLALGVWSAVKEWSAWWRVRKKANTKEIMAADLEAPTVGPFASRETDKGHFGASMNRQAVVHIADATSTIEEDDEPSSPIPMPRSLSRSRPSSSWIVTQPDLVEPVRFDPRLFMKKYAILFFLLLVLTLHALSILYLWQTPSYANHRNHDSSQMTWQASDVSCTLVYYFLFQCTIFLLMIWHAIPIFRWMVMVQLLKRPPRHIFWYLLIVLPVLLWCILSSAFVNGSQESDGSSSGFPVIDTLYWVTSLNTSTSMPMAPRMRVCYIATWSLAMKLGLVIPSLLCLGLLSSLVFLFRQRNSSSKRALSQSKRLNLIFSVVLLLLYGFSMLTLTDWHRKRGFRWAYEILLFGVMTTRLSIEVWPWLVYLLGRKRQRELDEKGSGPDSESVVHVSRPSRSHLEPEFFSPRGQAESNAWMLPDASSDRDTDAMGIAGLPSFPSHVRSMVQQGLEPEPEWTSFKDLPNYASSYIKH